MSDITTRLLASTVLAVGLIAGPAFAQDDANGDTGTEQVEGTAPAEGDEAAGTGPVETAAPNAPDQEPAFPEQTRADQPAEMPQIDVQTVAEDLPHLWAMEFLPDGRMLVSAKDGAMHIVTPEGEVGPEISGVPEVAAAGQGGLLDVILAPDFEESNRIFFSFAEPRDDGNGTSVASATLVADEENGGALEDVEVIFQQMPSYDGDKHFGSRLEIDTDNALFIAVGERSDEPIRDQAQDLGSGLGKVFRVTLEGEPFEGNPFIDEDGAQPEIFSYGHRNIQSATLDGEGRLWTVEHGPRGGDELNRPEAGLNYGWPTITYGIAYGGQEIGEGITQMDGMEQPVYYWDPSPAPSGMDYYEGEEFPEWEGAFLIGGLVSQGLIVLRMDGDMVASEERIALDARIRDVRVGPDGAVYAVTEDRDGGSSTILRLARAQD
ncbi:MAG: PQQ-dependent sugar dehydrogenase [Aliihoeflea sp.]|uniref:PQQ-dependent sugar dehydrogenase n=1 Tax=Aliihoeflea sp. TaxID=2608088 RepID=UPI004033F5BC